MPQQLKSGDDVTALMNGSNLESGDDVTALMNQAPEEEPRSLFEHVFTAPKFVTDAGKKVSEYLGHPSASSASRNNINIPVPYLMGLENLISGGKQSISLPEISGYLGGALGGAPRAPEGQGDILNTLQNYVPEGGLSGQLSPANIASMGLPLLNDTKAAMPMINKALGTMQMVHGTGNVIGGHPVQGAIDLGFGALGFAGPHATEEAPPELKLPEETAGAKFTTRRMRNGKYAVINISDPTKIVFTHSDRNTAIEIAKSLSGPTAPTGPTGAGPGGIPENINRRLGPAPFYVNEKGYAEQAPLGPRRFFGTEPVDINQMPRPESFKESGLPTPQQPIEQPLPPVIPEEPPPLPLLEQLSIPEEESVGQLAPIPKLADEYRLGREGITREELDRMLLDAIYKARGQDIVLPETPEAIRAKNVSPEATAGRLNPIDVTPESIERLPPTPDMGVDRRVFEPDQILDPEVERDIFGIPKNRDLTQEEVDSLKSKFNQDLMDSYGEDTVEGQHALDEVTGTIDTLSEEQKQINHEIMQANDEGYAVIPRGGRPFGRFIRNLSDGSVVVDPSGAAGRLNPILEQTKSDLDLQLKPIDQQGPEPDLQLKPIEPEISPERSDDISFMRSSGPEGEQRRPFYEGNDKISRMADEDFIRMEVGDREDVLRNMVGQYAEHGARVANKELLQNSIDALTNPNGTGKPGGKVNVHLDYHNTAGKGPNISVEDNGPGLNLDLIKNEYTTLTGSGKRGKGKFIGEMGVGKATYLLGTDSFEVHTVTREADGTTWQYDFEGNPEDLITGKIRVDKKQVPDNTPTGTKVTVYDKDKKNLEAAENFLENFHKYSNSPVEVNLTSNYFSPNPKTYKSPSDLDLKVTPRNPGPSRPVSTGSGPGADYTITVPDNANWSDKIDSINAIISNRGMFQGVEPLWFGRKGNIPDRVVIEIEPTVPATDAKNYPLTSPTRERMKDPFKNVIKADIRKNLIEAAEAKRQTELKAVYQGLVPHPIAASKGMDFVVHNNGGRYTAQELANVNNSPRVQTIAQVMKAELDHLDKLFPTGQLGKTAKYGFTLADPSDGGLNIPNLDSPPGAEENAQMINLFGLMKTTDTPKEAAQMMAHAIAHEFTHNLVREEGGNFTWAIAKTFAKFDLEAQLDYSKAILKALTDASGNYAPEIQNLLQEHTIARGRQDAKLDLLADAAAGRFLAKPAGQEGTISGNGYDGEGISRMGQGRGTNPSDESVVRLREAIEANKPLREEQESLYSSERGVRFREASKVKGQGLGRLYGQLKKLRGPLEKVEAQPISLEQGDIDKLLNLVNETSLPMGEKIRAQVALGKVVGEFEGVPTHSELGLLEQVFGGGIANDIIEMHGGLGAIGGGKVKKLLSESANFTKSMQASMDLSAPLRQGLPLAYRREYRGALSAMLEMRGSQKVFDAAQQALQERQLFDYGRKSGLHLGGINDVIAHREEAFMSVLAEKIPGVKASERAYVGFLNKLRADVFDNMVRDSFKAGLDPINNPKIGREIAKFVNTSTGRGSLGNFEKNALELNYLLFSPRLMMSRLQMLNPMYYKNLSPMVQKEALKALLAMAGLTTTFTEMARMAGATVSDDPTNADFRKPRIGNTRIDPYGGFQQYIVAAFKLQQQLSTSSVSGKSTQFGSSYVAPTSWSVLDQLRRTKDSPLAGFVEDILRGKDIKGQKTNIPAEVIDKVLPIIMNDLFTLAQEDPKLLGLAPAAIAGMGVQSYDQPSIGETIFPAPVTKSRSTGLKPLNPIR